MTNISELLDMDELAQMMADKRINKQVHPTLPISIYNYSARAQYLNQWTKAERVCRGLIVEDATGKVIARGPEKFMNYGQGKDYPLDTMVLVSKKLDGSLGIGWEYEGEFGIATRGSFTSDQSVFASSTIDQEMKDDISHCFHATNATPIMEIIYPNNRIVLDYGDFSGTMPLGAVDMVSGLIKYRATDVLVGNPISLGEALALPIPDDEEGYVLDICSGSTVLDHLKLKGDRYKQLHALLTNTTGRRIWVQLAARACHSYIQKDEDWGSMLGGDPADFKRVDLKDNLLDSLLTNVPDEFYDWVTKQIDSIEDNVSDLTVQAFTLANRVRDIEDNREQYEIVKDHPLATGILHLARTGNSDRIILKAWNISQPAGDETPFKTMED